MGSARTRAWRRAQRDRLIAQRTGRFTQYRYASGKEPVSPGQLAKTKGFPNSKVVSLECSCKAWNQLWRRADKMARAQQLRMPYPQREWDSIIHDSIP